MIKDLQKWLKKNDIDVNESVISMVLGAIVVILVGLLAYNYFRQNQPASETSTPAVPEEGEIATPTATVSLPATHTVTIGESLWTIAEMYYSSGFNYVDIAQANNLINPSNIDVGQRLTIPKVEIRTPTTNINLQPTVTAQRIDGASYTVVSGDNLWNIAVRAYGDGFRWSLIAQANNLANPDLIFAGNVFVIPR